MNPQNGGLPSKLRSCIGSFSGQDSQEVGLRTGTSIGQEQCVCKNTGISRPREQQEARRPPKRTKNTRRGMRGVNRGRAQMQSGSLKGS